MEVLEITFILLPLHTLIYAFIDYMLNFYKYWKHILSQTLQTGASKKRKVFISIQKLTPIVIYL